MKRLISLLEVYQNLSLLDRSLRTLLGFVLLTGTIVHFSINDVLGTTVTWHSYAVLVSIYPLLTGILGWDPCYWLSRAKTCGLSKKNQCGTFPQQVNAAAGRHLLPDNHDKASTTSHHNA